MDCLATPPDLLRYHFGALPEDERAAIDAHLPRCQPCLLAYLRLRRAVETPPPGVSAGDARPSDAARARLRAAVAQHFRPRPRQRLWRLLGRPVPLYQSAAAALVLMLLTGLAVLRGAARDAPSPALRPCVPAEPASSEVRTRRSPGAYYEAVDTARPRAASLDYL